VEVVGSEDRVQASLAEVRKVLADGLITLAKVDLYKPG
jgi:PII-like signaling protein